MNQAPSGSAAAMQAQPDGLPWRMEAEPDASTGTCRSDEEGRWDAGRFVLGGPTAGTSVAAAGDVLVRGFCRARGVFRPPAPRRRPPAAAPFAVQRGLPSRPFSILSPPQTAPSFPSHHAFPRPPRVPSSLLVGLLFILSLPSLPVLVPLPPRRLLRVFFFFCIDLPPGFVSKHFVGCIGWCGEDGGRAVRCSDGVFAAVWRPPIKDTSIATDAWSAGAFPGLHLYCGEPLGDGRSLPRFSDAAAAGSP